MPTKHEILKQYFGYTAFREGQELLIDGIVSGKDAVGVMPTGAGKSVCFQIPALLFDGITLVVSPLISLMKDQVSALTQAGVHAAFINSSLSERQIQLAIDNTRKGLYKIVYITPERLETPEFLRLAQALDISMLTVDEAHCISQWGQDFRPSYLKIADFVTTLPSRPVVSAFTATATSKVRDDIVSLLKLRDPTVLVAGFDRENLCFEVQKPHKKLDALFDFLSDKKDKSGIVYCSTRKAVEEVCTELRDGGYSAAPYHAGLPDRERHDNQDDFLYDRVQIMVATNAFGMGIDKSNVSFVVHYNMPKDIESYYQEAGRAGRDGSRADCVLFYSGQDVRTNMYLIENGNGREYTDTESLQALKERDRQRLKEMTYYCHTSDCLRSYILRYFGEKTANFCGNCSNCNTNFETVDITVDAQKILSCVIRAGERYGVKMIIDVLRGSKNEKILRLGLDKLSTFGICELSEKSLRDIVNHLVLNDFLYVTNDEYPVLKLGNRANEILRQGKSIEMKLVKDIEKPVKPRSKPTRPMNTELFGILKALRMKIANEQNVPAFVIFSDSTLTDMCMKLPANEGEFLQVSGVGAVKLERYGERFLQAIAEFVEGGGSETSGESPKSFDSAAIEISDEAVTISIIADRINCVLLQRGAQKLSGAKINDWLVSQGYLELVKNDSGANQKIPTDNGLELGITSERRVIRGATCIVNFYGKIAQAFITENIESFIEV